MSMRARRRIADATVAAATLVDGWRSPADALSVETGNGAGLRCSDAMSSTGNRPTGAGSLTQLRRVDGVTLKRPRHRELPRKTVPRHCVLGCGISQLCIFEAVSLAV